LDITASPDLLTVSEVASLLHVHPSRVYAMAHDGRLPAYKLPIRAGRGNVLRFDRAMLEAWLERSLGNDQVADAVNYVKQYS
jgi:excisionase family DNA binding protein